MNLKQIREFAKKRKFEDWEKRRKKGKKAFLLMHFYSALGFFAVSIPLAYITIGRRVDELERFDRKASLPVWPAVFVLAIMLPLAFAVGAFLWKRNEKAYEKYRSDNREKNKP